MFSKTNKPVTEAFSFDASAGEGTLSYYIGGLSEGSWQIKVNGTLINTVTVGKDSGMATFTAEAGEVELTPSFAALELELNGGALAEGVTLPTVYSYGEALTLPTDLVKYGSEFGGWYGNAACEGTAITEISADSRGAVKLYAKWIKVFSILKMELGGGSMSGDSTIALPSGKYTLPTDVTREGFVFVGWYLDEARTHHVSEIEANDDLTVYAGYVGYTEAVKAYSNTAGRQIGGASAVSYGDIISASSDKALTFVFIPDSGDLKSERNGHIRVRTRTGGNEIKLITVLNNEISAIDGTHLSTWDQGKRIEAIADFDDGEIRYYVGGKYVKTVKNVNFSKNLSEYNFASDSKIPYLWQYNAGGLDSDFSFGVLGGDVYTNDRGFGSITYERAGGTLAADAPVAYISGEPLTLPVPEKLGSEFGGWYLNSDLSGTPVSVLPADTKGDVTLYAKWNKTLDVLVMELCGGSMSGESIVALPSGTYTLPTDPKKAGCEFIGWYLEPDYITPVTEITPSGDGDVTVYARFAAYTEAVRAYANTAGRQIGGASGISYGDLISGSAQGSLTFTFIPNSSDLTSSRGGYFRVRTYRNSNEVKILQITNNDIKDASGRLLTTYDAGATVDIVADFAGRELRYYVNGEYVSTVASVAFSASASDYNFTGSPQIPYLWQYNAGGLDSDFSFGVLAADKYAAK